MEWEGELATNCEGYKNGFVAKKEPRGYGCKLGVFAGPAILLSGLTHTGVQNDFVGAVRLKSFVEDGVYINAVGGEV